MILFVSFGAFCLFGSGFYLLMTKGLLNRAFGLLLISHGANFVLISMAGLNRFPWPPLTHLGDVNNIADPLPQALILTALVIGFSVAAFLWALVLRLGCEEDAS